MNIVPLVPQLLLGAKTANALRGRAYWDNLINNSVCTCHKFKRVHSPAVCTYARIVVLLLYSAARSLSCALVPPPFYNITLLHVWG